MTQNDLQSIEPGHFRHVMGHYPTGVCVVTGHDPDGAPAGMVVGSFTAVSLTPPLVAFFPDRRSSSWPLISPSGRFCVNMLAADQSEICARFAAKGGNKFDGVAHRLLRGLPLIDNVIASMICAIRDETGAGDHLMVMGAVEEMTVHRDAPPLLFLKGQLLAAA